MFLRTSGAVIFFAIFFLGSYGAVPAYADQKDIIINEIAAYEKNDHEWIEIFNKGSEKVDLTGWKFFEGGVNHKLTVFRGTSVIGPGEYAIIANDASKVVAAYPSYTGTMFDSSWSSLAEKGEEIGLKNAHGDVIEKFTYLATTSGSLERKDASTPATMSTNWKEHEQGNTIGAKNSVNDSSPSTAKKSASGDARKNDKISAKTKNSPLIISEILPNPASQKSDNEFIELYNAGRDVVNLEGWMIGTLGGQTFVFHTADTHSLDIASKTYFVAWRWMTHVVLHNIGGDRVQLYPPKNDKPIATLAYQDVAPLGMSYALNDSQQYAWTQTPTPGEENSITTNNQGPDIVLEGTLAGKPGELMTFDASDSDDPDNNPLDFTWNFGDGSTGTGAIVNHTYSAPGTYTLFLSVGDGKKRTVRTERVTISSSAPQPSASQAKRVVKKIQTTIPSIPTLLSEKNVPSTHVRSLAKGSHVTVNGVVSVEPGVFSSSYFYIAGQDTQVWNPKKLFPPLHRGDRVIVRGVVKKNAADSAIRIADASAVHVDSHDAEPLPHDVMPPDIDEQNEGQLVRVSGEVQRVQWPNIYIGNGGSSLRIYTAPATHISRPAIARGDQLTVQGIVSQTRTGFRILPRDSNDLSLPKNNIGTAAPPSNGTVKKEQSTPHPTWQYVLVGVTALVVLLGGLLVEYLGKRKKKD